MPKKRGKSKSSRTSQPSVTEPTDGNRRSPVNIPINLQICRLCESKDGPFLDIFAVEKNTAKKIEELMPIRIAENDELPHKICFRCSAKVEELYEFVQKCIKTQENIYSAMGKKYPLISKSKTHSLSRSLWEEKLNKSNITNDDICDAVIKKAMEGIKDIPLQKVSSDSKTVVADTAAKTINDNLKNIEDSSVKKKSDVNGNTSKIKQLNEDLDKCNVKRLTRASRSNVTANLLDGSELEQNKKSVKNKKIDPSEHLQISPPEKINTTCDLTIHEENSGIHESSKKQKEEKEHKEEKAQKEQVKEKEEVNKLNIMNYISKIKVSGVGILFQCRLCNRNFLSENVVLSHWCAKYGQAKEDFTKKYTPPEPPKIPNIKYINTKTADLNLQTEQKSSNIKNSTDMQVNKDSVQKNKPKPRIGPASKVKRVESDTVPSVGMVITPRETTPPPPVKNDADQPAIQIPKESNLYGHYKLIPGVYNTYNLVEVNAKLDGGAEVKENATKKRKISKDVETAKKTIVNQGNLDSFAMPGGSKRRKSEVIDLDSPVEEKPYPVGLIHKVSHSRYKGHGPPYHNPAPFTTSAQKKQSYTVVQTSHPNKLLISAKPQTIEPVSSKNKRSIAKGDLISPEPDKPENTHSEDPGFFTFVNVDPLLTPMYVLPTDTISQECQIAAKAAARSISNEDGFYSCNMCSQKFTREQKLLAHITSHYNKMDEEDHSRIEKHSRKRGKKL